MYQILKFPILISYLLTEGKKIKHSTMFYLECFKPKVKYCFRFKIKLVNFFHQAFLDKESEIRLKGNFKNFPFLYSTC